MTSHDLHLNSMTFSSRPGNWAGFSVTCTKPGFQFLGCLSPYLIAVRILQAYNSDGIKCCSLITKFRWYQDFFGVSSKSVRLYFEPCHMLSCDANKSLGVSIKELCALTESLWKQPGHRHRNIETLRSSYVKLHVTVMSSEDMLARA